MAYPVISLLAVGLNISNTLPDLEGDAIAGVRGFTHMLGLTRALLLLWLLLAGSMALMELNRTNSTTSDLLRGSTNITYAGTLSLVNIGPPLQAGDPIAQPVREGCGGSHGSQGRRSG